MAKRLAPIACPAMVSRFAADSAVTPIPDEPGAFLATIDRGWWIERGPNGGYVAAILSRAVEAAVADPSRTLRSLTIHYLRPPTEGQVRLSTTIERQGRSMTTVSVRMEQADRSIALALAAVSSPRDGLVFDDATVPDVVPPEDIDPVERGGPPIPMRDRYQMRWALGPLPFSGGSEARSGGWIRLNPDEAAGTSADAHLLVALTDAWIPPVFGRASQPLGVPTVDLTVHLRAPVPEGYDDWFLAEFRSRTAVDGFLEEDGRIWTRDGLLVAQSRQLAVLI